jgi:hypothetical protein
VALMVAPMATTNLVGPQNVVLTLNSNANYAIGSNRTASITLTGDTVPPSSLRVTASGASLGWNSITNHTYRIAYKNKLTDAAWQFLTNINAIGSVSFWIDPAANTARQRFYVVSDATGTLTGTVVPLSSVKLTTAGAMLQWSGSSAHKYSIGYKNSLTDPSWFVIANLPGADGIMSWTDTSALSTRERFYLVEQIN